MKWNIKTLRKHLEQRFDFMDKAMTVAAGLMDKRLDEMNNIRRQLDEQIKTFVSIEKFDGEMRNIHTELKAISKLVYIGLGVWILLQVIIVYVLTVIFK